MIAHSLTAKHLTCTRQGFDELAASLDKYTPENVEAVTGVAADVIRSAAELFAKAPAAAVVVGAGTDRPGQGIELVKAGTNLALITGNIGKVGGGVYVFGEKANSQGVLDMGLTPGMLPGFRSVTNPEDVKALEAVWGSGLPQEKGLGAKEILAGVGCRKHQGALRSR